MSSRVIPVALVSLLLAGLLALLGAGLARQTGAVGNAIRTSGPTSEARLAPDLVLDGFDGRTVRLSDLRGQVVVVNFWASWCAPCRDETAALERVWQAHRDRGVAFVGVATWDSQQQARDFARKAGVTYPSGLDAKGDAAVEYRVTGIPETFLVDQDGLIVRRWLGQIDEASLSAALSAIAQREPRALSIHLGNRTPGGRA